MDHQTKRSPGGKILWIGILSILFVIGVAFGIYWYSTADDRLYKEGVALMDAADYEGAIAIFEALPDYEQAAGGILEARYQIAAGYFEDKCYEEAAQLFSSLEAYADSAQLAQQSYYQLGTAARLEKDYEKAKNCYSLAGDYSDASTQVQRMIYAMGHAAFLEKDYPLADECFQQLKGSQTDYGNMHYETLEDAEPYLTEQRLNLSDRINIHIDLTLDEAFYETLRNIFPCQYYYANYYKPEQLLTIAGIHYYPAENILYAIKNEDTSHLTEDEITVMKLAQEVVDQALEETETPYETEKWLHDWLCNQVTYESPNMDIKRRDYIQLRELSCIGAMLDGIANCQGYADAFYLLGNMAGFEVGRMLGTAGEGHIWNTIVLDGKEYIVDVTFDDLSDQNLNGWSYTYFNTFRDSEVYDPFGDDQFSTLVTEQDLSQTYFRQEGLLFGNLDDAVRSLVDQQINEGKEWTYAVVENEKLEHEQIGSALKSILYSYYRSFYWIEWVEHYGDSTYIMIYWY